MSVKVLAEYARVEAHSAENRTFDVLSHIPPCVITGIHSPKNRKLYQTPGLQLMHPAALNSAQSPKVAILGNGSDTDSHYGELNRTAKNNLEAILDQSLISDGSKYHEKAVGHVGQANFVMQFDYFRH